MAPKSLAPGVRFHPTDVELVKYYLQKKVTGKRIRFDVISEVDVYKFSPSDLPDKSQLKSMDLEWYFFCPREKKYVNGARMNRATEYGYWKTTGRDRLVKFNDKTVAMIKTLIFHEGRAPKGNRTDWVMHEYRLKDEDLAKTGINQDAYVICKIFLKSGPGPRPTQHLFKEDDWSDDDDDYTSLNTCPSTDSSFPTAAKVNNPGCSTVTDLYNINSISTDASIQVSPLKSIKVLKEGDNESISLLELPNSPKELPSVGTMQKGVPTSELHQVSNSRVCGIKSNYNSNFQRQKGMHGSTCLSNDGLPPNAIFSTRDMLSEGNCMLPSRSHGGMIGFSDNINHPEIAQSATLDCPDLYKELDCFFDMEVQSGYEESFIELDDLTTPLDNELHWSNLIPSDGLSNEVDQHGCEVPPFLSAGDHRGSSCNDAPGELPLMPESSLGFINCADIPRKDDADEIENGSFFCIESWRQWQG